MQSLYSIFVAGGPQLRTKEWAPKTLSLVQTTDYAKLQKITARNTLKQCQLWKQISTWTTIWTVTHPKTNLCSTTENLENEWPELECTAANWNSTGVRQLESRTATPN